MAEKRSYTINTLRGVDLSSSPINVSSTRASYMRNMISKGGVNHKRNGWCEITSFGNSTGELPINGIFDYIDPTTKTKHLIVHADTSFFKCSTDFSIKTQIATASDVTITNTKSRAYYKDGLLWILGCGDFLVYDGNKIIKVINSKFAYTPTTAIGITADGKLDALEGANMLSNRRKNKIIGGAPKQIKLDNAINEDFPVNVEISVIPNGYCLKLDDESLIKNQIITLSIKIDSLTSNNYFCIKTGFCYINGTKREGVIVNSEGESLIIDEFLGEGLPILLTNGFFNGSVRGVFGTLFNASPPLEGESNITVEYTADYEGALELSTSCVMPCYGDDVLIAVHGNNVLYFSDVLSPNSDYGFGYFPVDNFVVVGNDKDPITAVVPLGDSSVGVFKKNSFYRVNFSLQLESDTQDAELIPQIVEAFDSAGCINQDVAVNVNADTLVFNQNGVFGVEFNTNTRSLKMRSSCVNKELCAYSYETLSSAVACEHEGRYYLFIDGKVYIADSRFKVYESNRLDTSFEYEWWVWDNCPAKVVCSIDGKLYMGRENGRIAVFDDKFTDRRQKTITSGDGDFTSHTIAPKSKTLFYTSDYIGIKEGDRVQIENAYSCLGNFLTSITNKGVRVVVEQSLVAYGLIYVGAMVYFESDEELKPYEIIDVCFENDECVAYINASECGEKEVLLISLEGRNYVVVDKKENLFNLIDEQFYGAENPIIQCYASLSREEKLMLRLPEGTVNVECEYKTPVMNLGTEIQAKNLWKIAITVSNDTVGEVLVGYETNVNNVLAKKTVAGAFDYNALDFKTFTFESGFYKSYVKRMLERNFNYICFKFASKSNGDFAIESFTFVYSINGVLKGDR